MFAEDLVTFAKKMASYYKSADDDLKTELANDTAGIFSKFLISINSIN